MSGVSPVASAIFTSATYATNLAALNSLATFSTAGLGTQFDSTGKLTYAPNNLLTYSNTFSDAAWTKQANVTVTDGQTAPDASTATLLSWGSAATGIGLYQVVSEVNGAGTIKAVWVYSASAGGTIKLADPHHTVGITTATLVVGWQQISLKDVAGSQPTSGGLWLLKTASSPATLYIRAATLSAVTYETTPRTQDQVITTSAAYYGPRFDYTYNGSSWVPAGLLVEGAATNLAPQSNAITTAPWSVTGATTITSGAATSPDGTVNAWKLQTTAATLTFGVYQPFTYTAATYTHSIFAKAGNYNYICLDFTNAGTAGAVFDLSNGTVGYTDAGVTAAVQSLGGGWYRLSATAARTAVASFPEVYFSGSRTANVKSWAAAGTEYLYVFGYQLELGSSATSYIPTAASAVTRPAETVQLTGTALSTALGSVASAFVEVGGLPVQSGTICYLQYGAGSGILLGMSGGSATTVYEQNTAGSAFATAVAGSGSIATTLRAGVSWGSTGGRKLVANGGTVATDASNNELATGTVNLGQGQGTYINGWLRSFAIYNSRLPDATLQSKSIVGASY